MWDDPHDLELEGIGFSGSDLEPEDLEFLQGVSLKGLANSSILPTTHQTSWYGPWRGEGEEVDRRYIPIWDRPWTMPQVVEIWRSPKLLEDWTTPQLYECRMPPIPKRPTPRYSQHFPGEMWEHLDLAIAERNKRD